MTHTPGPWNWDMHRVHLEAKEGTVLIDDLGLGEDDANLIAAAPELLEAAKRLCAAGDNYTPNMWSDLEDAIAKAEGK